MRARRRILALLIALVGSAGPTPVRAYEDTATLGLAFGWAGIPSSHTLPRNGVSLALNSGFGIGDAWAIQGVATYALFPGADRVQIGIAGLETYYLLDLVRFVPFVGAGLDGFVSGQSHGAVGDFALHALVGVDFLINPRWLIGADVRGYWITTSARSPLDPFFVTVAARVGVQFDTR